MVVRSLKCREYNTSYGELRENAYNLRAVKIIQGECPGSRSSLDSPNLIDFSEPGTTQYSPFYYSSDETLSFRPTLPTSKDCEVSLPEYTLAGARKLYFSGQRDIHDIKKIFSGWSLEPSYLVFRKRSLCAVTPSHSGAPCTEIYGEHTWTAKASKRGNDVYAVRVETRFSDVRDYTKGVVYFDAREKHGIHMTKALFITLTYAPDKVGSPDDSWKSVSGDWNRFITAMRKRYGKIASIRAYESTGNGYAHVHALLFFEEMEFPARWHNKHWRLIGKGLKNKIGKLWHMGFSDVLTLPSAKEAVNYVGKYITKGLELNSDEGNDSKSLLTNTYMWIYRKRSFSISKDIQRAIRPTDLKTSCITQTAFSNKNVGLVKTECLGIVVMHLKESYRGTAGPPGVIPHRFEVPTDDLERVMRSTKARNPIDRNGRAIENRKETRNELVKWQKEII